MVQGSVFSLTAWLVEEESRPAWWMEALEGLQQKLGFGV